MKKTILAATIAMTFATPAIAEFRSTWLLQRAVITDTDNIFDTALDSNIQIAGIMKVINDKYTIKGSICDNRIEDFENRCVPFGQELTIKALDADGLWADVEDTQGTVTTVHIIDRTPDSKESLTLMFTDTDWGVSVVQSFKLTGHYEDSEGFEFNGVGMLEGKMMLDQIHANQ